MSLDRARAGHDQASEQGLIPVQIGPGQAGQARARQGSRSNLPHPPPLPRRPGSPAPRHHMLQGRQGTVRQGTVDNKRAPSVAPRDLDASRLLPGHGGRAATYLPGRALLQTVVGQILQVWVSFHVNSFIHRQRLQRDILHLCECRGPKKRPSKHSNTHTHTHTQPTRLATTRRPHHTSLTLFFFSVSLSCLAPITQPFRQYRTRRETPPNRLRSLHRVWTDKTATLDCLLSCLGARSSDQVA